MLSNSITNALIYPFRKEELIGTSEIAVTMATSIFLRGLPPKLAEGHLASIINLKSHVSVREHRVFSSPYTSTADCLRHCEHFSRYFGCYNFRICKQQVLQSCLNYTTNHLNLTTTNHPAFIEAVVYKRVYYHRLWRWLCNNAPERHFLS